MRIQHNIPALNAYRNYSSNTTAVSKSLEKLSSGYRINRAGDDAAGLAISEKMRAQITGLKAANKNAKDGISLVQTAEGALTEVHSMLNRMVDLAQQSANGTFDNEVDRANLMKEFTKLNEEIDRIADSTNFNGIKLLNGDLGGGSSTAGVSGKLTLADALKATTAGGYVAADSSTSDIVFTTANNAYAAGDKVSLKVADSDGGLYTIDFEVIAGDKLKAKDGTEYSITAGGVATDDDLAKAFAGELGKIKGLSDKFTFDTTTTAGTLSIISKDKGANAATIEMSALSNVGTGDGDAAAVATAKGTDAYDTFDVSDYLGVVGNSGWDKTGTADAKDAVIDINGQKFAIAADAASAAELVKQFGKDLNVVMYDTNAGKTGVALQTQINAKTGLSSDGAVAGGADTINLKGTPGSTTAGSGGLVLQIGDTSEAFNKLTVSVGDMHSAALGIASLNIGNQDGASAAVAKLKDAINSVSSTRGELGATQNRLEHTRNNLSVTTENITDAEASIRDVDIAEEMMAYTKNNILVQSAQAMLAQANQMPQGVLQLLQ